MILKSLQLGLGLVAAIILTGNAQAQGDAAAGEQKTVVCAACHGPGGTSVNPQFPNIAGQVPGHIAKQLAFFKSGVRQNPMMTVWLWR